MLLVGRREHADAKQNNRAVWTHTGRNPATLSGFLFAQQEKIDMAKQLPIEVLSVGVWKGFKFTLPDLKEMAANFIKLKDIIKPPIKLGHTKDETGAPAYGWISDLKVKGNKLIAYAVDMPPILLKAIKARRYRRVSSEVFTEYHFNGTKYGKVFSALALLGAEAPAVKDLEDLQAYLTQNPDEHGTFEKIMAFDAPSEFQFMDDEGDNDMKPEEIQEKLDKITGQLTTLTATNTTLKAENKDLKAKLEKQEKKAFSELKDSNAQALKTFCDEQVKEGRMLPAQRDILCRDGDKLCFTDTGDITIGLEQFKKYVELTGKVLDKKQHAEGGDGNKESFTDVQQEVDTKTLKFMADKGEKDYTIALDAVLDADQDLAKRYSDSFAVREREE